MQKKKNSKKKRRECEIANEIKVAVEELQRKDGTKAKTWGKRERKDLEKKAKENVTSEEGSGKRRRNRSSGRDGVKRCSLFGQKETYESYESYMTEQNRTHRTPRDGEKYKFGRENSKSPLDMRKFAPIYFGKRIIIHSFPLIPLSLLHGKA